jgi:hypothetical protein
MTLTSEIVVAEFARQLRLVVPFEIWPGAPDIGPFGKAIAPPFGIFRHDMELREIKGDQPGVVAQDGGVRVKPVCA